MATGFLILLNHSLRTDNIMDLSRIKVCDVRYFNNFRLWTRFNTGEAKIFDFRPLLGTPAYAPLADKAFPERS
jgi:hypothetical protein